MARVYLLSRCALSTQTGDLDRARAVHAKLLGLASELAVQLERIVAGASAPDDDGLASTDN
jgi:hypothetical protein